MIELLKPKQPIVCFGTITEKWFLFLFLIINNNMVQIKQSQISTTCDFVYCNSIYLCNINYF